ncbi:MAG: DUF3073 domain-containing protein [Actinomycetes bacterium]|jgi:Protein of unknown function (DUF3073)
MGRGRQKAKATRVARDLKYSGPDMDLERLAKELHGETPVSTTVTDESDEDPYADDNYAKRA